MFSPGFLAERFFDFDFAASASPQRFRLCRTRSRFRLPFILPCPLYDLFPCGLFFPFLAFSICLPLDQRPQNLQKKPHRQIGHPRIGRDGSCPCRKIHERGQTPQSLQAQRDGKLLPSRNDHPIHLSCRMVFFYDGMSPGQAQHFRFFKPGSKKLPSGPFLGTDWKAEKDTLPGKIQDSTLQARNPWVPAQSSLLENPGRKRNFQHSSEGSHHLPP